MQNMISLVGLQYPQIVIPQIDNANQSIHILMFDWRWPQNDLGSPLQLFNQALVRAVRRGVSVTCLLNNSNIIPILTDLGFSVQKIKSENILHGKLLIIDEQIVTIGSHNLTANAFENNFETSVLFHCPSVAVRFLDYFKSLWQ